MNVASRTARLNVAIARDRAAKQEALQRGMSATRPLTVTRLRELCALGEQMIVAARALADAERSVLNATPSALDFVLPAGPPGWRGGMARNP